MIFLTIKATHMYLIQISFIKTSPHIVAPNLLEIDRPGFELLNNPTHSPDLHVVPMNFKVFPEVKSWYVETNVKWIRSYKKWIGIQCDYVENSTIAMNAMIRMR